MDKLGTLAFGYCRVQLIYFFRTKLEHIPTCGTGLGKSNDTIAPLVRRGEFGELDINPIWAEKVFTIAVTPLLKKCG